MPSPWRIIAAPLDSAGRDGGETRAPAALLAAGLASAFRSLDVVELDTAVRSSERDPDTGVIGLADVQASAVLIADAVAQALTDGRQPLVVGGDCGIVPGIISGARRRLPGLGLLFVDGHLDVYDGRTSTTGEAADMDLSVLTGHGPDELVPPGSPRFLMEADRVAAIGYRRDAPRDIVLPDHAHPVAEIDVVDRDVHVQDTLALRRTQPYEIASVARNAIGGRPTWLHFDVDVIDPEELPAVGYPQAGGPSLKIVGDLLACIAEGGLAGAHITCFDADADPTGEHARTLVELVSSLREA